MRIPGKLNDEDVPSLALLIRGRNVLMLGCYCGRALIHTVKTACVTWVLEDFKGYDGSIEGIAEELKANVERYVPQDAEVNLLFGRPESWTIFDNSRSVEPTDGVIDVVYRDADRPEVLREVDNLLAMQFLRRTGGTYAWHDQDDSLKWLVIEPVPVEVN